MCQIKELEEWVFLSLDYLPSSEDKVKGLMMRHRTLSESNGDLITNVVNMADEVRQFIKRKKVQESIG